MRKFIYQLNHEYFTIEADSLEQAMIDMPAKAVMLGDYTQWSHLFNE